MLEEKDADSSGVSRATVTTVAVVAAIFGAVAVAALVVAWRQRARPDRMDVADMSPTGANLSAHNIADFQFSMDGTPNKGRGINITRSPGASVI